MRGAFVGTAAAAAVALACGALVACHASNTKHRASLGPSSQSVGTLPPTLGPPVITVLAGAAGPVASARPLVGQSIPSNGPVTVAGIRLAEVATTVVATNATTGQHMWSFHDGREPGLLEFVVGGGVVAIEVGHEVGAAMVYVATEQLDVVDLATGTPLWRTTVPGDAQAPAITAMPELVVFETLGRVVAVHARSGVQAWTAASPAGCAVDAEPGPGGRISLASDPGRLAATVPCGDGVVTERLNPAAGAALWTTPTYPGGDTNLLAVPVNTDVVVIPEMGAGRFLTGPSRAWTPPGVTEAVSGGAIYTVLDAATGQPRWTETGAPIYNTGVFGNNDGAVCFIGEHTYECRTSRTGSLVRVGGPAY